MTACGCNDWHTTQRAAMLRRQGQRVPIPRAVLEGATAGISRRDFLRNGAIATITVYGASMLSWSRIWEAAAAQAATPGGVTDPIIVSIFLDGGNDGLNTLVPVDNQNYAGVRAGAELHRARPERLPRARRARPRRRTSSGTRPRPDSKQLYDAGKMAVIPAVDYLPPDLSHFHSRAFWQAGELDPNPATGWLGRWVDQNGDPDNPLQALSVDWTLQGSMKSAANPVAVLTSPQSVQYDLNGVWTDESLMVQTLGDLAQRTPKHAQMAAADKAVGGAVDVANQLAGLGYDHDPAERVRLRHERLRRAHVDAVVADPLEPGRARRLPELRRRLRLPRQPGEPPGGRPLVAGPDAGRVPGRPRGPRHRRPRARRSSGASSGGGSTTTTRAAAAPITAPAASRWSSGRT